MLLNNCFTQTPTNNLLFPNCCCRIVCSLVRQSGEPNKTISSIAISGGTATIISIEGVPYTGPTDPPLPIALVGSTPILVEIEVCGTTIGNLFNSILTVIWTSGGGGSQNFTLPFLTVNPASYFSPGGPNLSFGVVPFGSSAAQTVNITNPTKCPVTYQFTTTCVNPELSFNQPSTFIVPANSTVPFTATWSPTISGDNVLDCVLNVYTFCNSILTPVFDKKLDGVAAVFSSCLNCVDITFQTENNYLPAQNGFCSIEAGEIVTLGAIAEKKKITFEFYYPAGINNGLQFYFNPWLFDFVCNFGAKYPGGSVNGPPPVSWFVSYNGTLLPQTMTLIGAGAAANSQKNFSAVFVPVSSTQFKVEFEFFLIEDLDDWVSNVSLQNQPKLLRNHVSNPNPIDNTVQSVYNTDKNICSLFFLVDPYIQIPDPLGGPGTVDFTCYEVKNIPVTFRFYNRGLYDGPSEFLNPVFQLRRGTTTVTNLSTVNQTEVWFDIDTPFGSAPDGVIFHVIDAANTNDLVDFLTNYDSSRALITTIGVPGVIDNHLHSPSQQPTLVAGTTYRTKAFIDTTISPSGSFYIIAIVYEKDGPFMVNSFISGPYSVTEIPGPEDCCPLRITSVWEDYLHTFFNASCFRPTMKERVRHLLRMNGASIAGCFGDGEDFSRDRFKEINVTVYRRVDNFPNPGQSTFFIFDKFRSVRTIGFPGNWDNQTPGFVVADSTSISTEIFSQLDLRVRYEDNLVPSTVEIANTATPFSRLSAGPLSSVYATANSITYDWAEQEIIVEYQVKLDLSVYFGTPFENVQVFIAGLKPWDFETTVDPYLDAIELFYLDGNGNPDLNNPLIGNIVCSNAADKIAVRVHKIIEPDLAFFAFLDGPNNYTVTNLQEEESFFSNAAIPLTASSSPSLSNVDSNFGPDNYAFFIINLNTLAPGKYQICGLGKKLLPGERLKKRFFL